MAVKVENSFLVPASIELAWTILTDVPRITPCMPGAELTEVVDANTFKGLARVKIGPMQLAFAGEAKLEEVDTANRSCKLSIRGNDTKGRGNVASEMRFALSAEGESSTRVNVMTDLTLSGSVAQYGRGVGLIKEICNRFANEFAANLARQIESGGEAIASGGAKPLSAIGLVSGAVKAMVTRKDYGDGSV
jgi:carbon monoxide dehydrogenase subunit G